MAMAFIDVIKNSATPIVALGVGMVASAAYHIFIGCPKRYVFSNTILLQHDGEITIQNSSSKAKDTMAFIDKLEERVKQHVLSCSNMTAEFYDDHYDQELYMYADEAKEWGCVDGIIGTDITLSEIFE